MPRPASIAVAGYFPTPENLLPQIAALVDTTPAYQPRIVTPGYRGGTLYSFYGRYVLLDPCAGDGTALVKLAQQWFPPTGPITNPQWDEDAREMVENGQARYTVPANATVNYSTSYSHSGPQVTVLGCEMEKERANRLGANLRHELDYLSGKAFHADALTLSCKVGNLDLKGVSILYLNPPYSPDKVYGRLEQHFLEHFTPALIPGQGIVVFVVPHYALTSSARYLAQHYEDITCYRFPQPDFERFGQVVLVARRAPVEEGSEGASSWLWQAGSGDNAAANNPVVKTILEWANHPESLPVLGETGTRPVVKLAEQQQAGITLEETKLDIPAMLKLAPIWQPANSNNSSKAGTGANLLSAYGPARELGLDKTIGDLVGQPYPVAAPPKPAHLAMALASGIFNGKRITPDDPQGTGLPGLLVKGVFSRDFKTVSTNTNKAGEVTSSVQVQQPSLKVMVLDLSTSTYHEIKGLSDSAGKTSATTNSRYGSEEKPTDNNNILDLEALVEQALTDQTATVTTGPAKIVNVAELSLLDLLNYYGGSLTALMAEQFPALHQPANPLHQLVLPVLPRRLFKVQEQAVMAVLKLLAGGINPFIVGQPGTGKTTMSLAIMAALSEAHFVQTIEQLKKLGHLNTSTTLKPVKRALVVCPPINVATWAVEIPAVLPGAKVVVVQSVNDLAAVDSNDDNQSGQNCDQEQAEKQAGAGLTIYLLSRENAKLGHGWRSGAYEVELKRLNKATGRPRTYRDLRCPRCGATIEEKTERLVKGRLRCDHSPLVALDSTARLVEKLAALLARLPGATLKETKADRLLQMLWQSHRYMSQLREKLDRATTSLTKTTDTENVTETTEIGKVVETGSGSSEHLLDELVVNHLLRELVELVLATYRQHGTDAHKQIATLSGALVKLAWGLSGAGAGLGVKGLDLTLAQLADWLYRQSLVIEEGEQAAKAKVAATTIPASVHSHKDAVNETGKGIRRVALELLLNVSLHRAATNKDGHEEVAAIEAGLRQEYYTNQRRLWDELEQTRNWLVGAANGRTSIIGAAYSYSYIGWKTYTLETVTGNGAATGGNGSGQSRWFAYGHEWGSLAAVGNALKELVAIAQFKRGPVCGEVLYQAAPKPRRLSLAKYISRNRRRFFDLLILDELQEYANSGTAQTKAAHRLVELPGVPAIGLSGSLTNGYASSLFATMWAFSEHFRREFGREDKQVFVTRYGYRKQLVAAGGDGGNGDGSNRQVLAYGSVSDLETQVQEDGVIRQLGEAPGVLPLFVLRYLLPVAVMVQKRELELELPPVTEQPVLVEFEKDNEQDQLLYRAYVDLRNAVVNQVKQDRFSPTLAGKLWGAVTELPGYLDLCHADTGNRPALAPAPVLAAGKGKKQNGSESDGAAVVGGGNRYVISYPESCGGRVIAVGESFPADYITPKERWLLATLKSELAEGRNVMVFLRHTGSGAGKGKVGGGLGLGLAGRLKRLIEEQTGEQVAVLASDKVSTAKRQDWLSQEVIAKGRRILLLNPKTVKTGLNNLVAFSTAVWFELDHEPITYIQGNGRLDRPNQTRDVRIFFPVYAGTAQEIALNHLANKVKASLQVDGLDVVSALEAAGAGGSDQAAMQTVMNLGRAIYEKLVG